ncbi:MAG: peptidase dimerization domain-containing protein, partial [Acidobacteria bacterium]|nr:peptidase dimerization domain-containing protein [Acidobacteriota bacterium]
MTRTTVAMTKLRGSAAANVLASQAVAHANIRVAVGESVEQTVQRLRRIIHDDRVSVTVLSASEPSPVSATDNAQFAALTAAVGAVFPDAIVVPYIMMAATDSRRFTGICPAVYRFA